MDALSANEAKTQFGELLMRVQRAPVQIRKNGKPVAVVMSTIDYESLMAQIDACNQIQTSTKD